MIAIDCVRRNALQLSVVAVFLTASISLFAPLVFAQDLPGRGRMVQPTYNSLEGLFQTFVVVIGLEKLGYEVKKPGFTKPAMQYLAVAQGDIDFSAEAWLPTQQSFWEAAGKESKMTKFGPLVANATAGYFVDKRTAEKYGLTTVDQLKDPKIAQLFDTDGSGKAALYGCPQGWGCELRIEHHLDAYGLRATVRHVKGEPPLLAADFIRRFRESKPVLFFTYTPQWISQVLVPGKDVEYLTVPFTSLPGAVKVNTTLPDGRNIGHPINNIYIIAAQKFVRENHAAAKFFEIARIPLADVNAQNYKLSVGEKSFEQIRAHAEEWISANRSEFDSWIEQAKRAAK